MSHEMEVQLMLSLSLSLLTVSLCLSLTSSLFFQGEPINMLPTWHWITKACFWLPSENQPCAAFLCRCLCQFLSDICVLTCAPFWRTHLDKTPKARRHCTQWSKGKAIIAILPEGGCFSFRLFFLFSLSLLLSAQTIQPLRLICFSFFHLRWPAGLTAFIAHPWRADVEV